MPPSGNHLQWLPRSVALGGKGSFLRKLPIEFALGAGAALILAKDAKTGKRRPPEKREALNLPPSGNHLQWLPRSVALGGKNSLVGKSMLRNSSQGLSLEATHSFSGMQKS